MKKAEKKCQSCGMPMKKSPNGGGTEQDGSISLKYCANCYENGVFRQPDLSLEEMQDIVKNKMKQMGLPSFMTGGYLKGLSKLDRWKNA